jgi:hypothetical protein
MCRRKDRDISLKNASIRFDQEPLKLIEDKLFAL